MMILDSIIAVMLVVSIVYSWKLNQKMIDLRGSRNDLTDLIKVLDTTILRADSGLEELKALSLNTSNDFNNKIEKARILSDELAYMIDRANLVSDKLDSLISNSRQVDKATNTAEEVATINFDNNKTYQINPSLTKELMDRHSDETNLAIDMDDLKAKLQGSEGDKKLAIESLLTKISVKKKNSVDA